MIAKKITVLYIMYIAITIKSHSLRFSILTLEVKSEPLS